ncbi:MAG: hypothetical protein HY826_04525 [Actinobacteria bacterium]|nr:hypothetical protein [Actinomycetota bacterium]
MRQWLVAADDRTGAFEVAAAFAEVVGPVTVTVGEAMRGSGVVDLGSRALPANDAARMAAAIDATPSAWVGHKIDSTLRGNWADELTARQRVTGRRAVVLPAWPDLGRTCVGGVVLVDGSPIGSVLECLSGADLLADVDELRAWLAAGGATAVCDVPTSDAMNSAAAALAGHDVLVVGPAGPLGAAFAAHWVTSGPTTKPTPTATCRPPLATPVLVVCGSANGVSREQIRRLRVARPTVEIVATDVPDGELHLGAVATVAAHARSRTKRLRPGTIVVIGGDTAADLLGDSPRIVGGFAAAGMPWSRDESGDGSLVISKAGGFGSPDALVDLFDGETC